MLPDISKARRTHLRITLGCLLLLFSGCIGNDLDDDLLCQDAVDYSALCHDIEPLEFTGSCEGEAATTAEEILEMSCEQLLAFSSMGAADGFFCDTWIRWLGLCDEDQPAPCIENTDCGEHGFCANDRCYYNGD